MKLAFEFCSKCGRKHQRRGQRYCRVCHAQYQKKWSRDRREELHELRRRVSGNASRETKFTLVTNEQESS